MFLEMFSDAVGEAVVDSGFKHVRPVIGFGMKVQGVADRSWLFFEFKVLGAEFQENVAPLEVVALGNLV